MPWFKDLFSKPPFSDETHDLYNRIVAQARVPALYDRLCVPDTLEGRFDLLCVHAFLVMHRLKAEGESTQTFNQALFDLMFQDVEQNLRVVGVSDIRIGKKVKERAEAFGGRLKAYDAGLAADDDSLLVEALTRNVYRELPEGEPEGVAAELAAYLRAQAAFLAEQPLGALLQGRVDFLPVDPASPSQTGEAS